MNHFQELGLGTKLRLLLANLDGELADIYRHQNSVFRPRFYPVFQLLLERNEASVSEVTSRLQCSQPAATQTLVEMKRLGLIAEAKGNDRRKRIVQLTPYAFDVARALQPTWDAVACAASQLDAELSHPLSAILDEALAALARKSFLDRISEHRPPKGRTD